MATAAPNRGLLGRIFLRKTVAQVQRETETSELKRSLGPWNLVFLGIGCIIGAGIFVRTGNAAALHAGPAVLFSYIIAGIVCAFAGSAMPSCRRRFRCQAPPTPTATRPSASSRPGHGRAAAPRIRPCRVGGRGRLVGLRVSLLADMGIHVPAALTGPAGYPKELADGTTITTVFNLPAFLICLPLALLLVVGVSNRQGQQPHRRDQGDGAGRLHHRRRLPDHAELRRLRAELAAVHPGADGGRASSAGAESFARFDRVLRLHRLRSGLYGSPGSETEEGHADRDHRPAPGLHGHLHPGLDRPHAGRTIAS